MFRRYTEGPHGVASSHRAGRLACGTMTSNGSPTGTARESLVRVEDAVMHYPVRMEGVMGRRRRLRAVDGVSFSISEGEALGLVGGVGVREVHGGQADHAASFPHQRPDRVHGAGHHRSGPPGAAPHPPQHADRFPGSFRLPQPRYEGGGHRDGAFAGTRGRPPRPGAGGANCWSWWGSTPATP